MLVLMARMYLVKSLIPSTFWFFSIKKLCDIINYLKVILKGVFTSPFNIYHHVKPYLGTLFQLLSVEYIDKLKDIKNHRNNFQSQALN